MEPVQCEFCKKLFCLKHRLESDHSCPSIQNKISMEDIHKKNKDLVKQRLAAMKKKKGIK